MLKGSTSANFLISFATVLMAIGCGGSDKSVVGPTVPPVIIPPVLVAGTADAFEADIGTVVVVEPFVTLKNQYGTGVASVWIYWSTSSGTTERDSSQTDFNGRASAGQWTLGTVSGKQTVTARQGGVSLIAMTAKVAPGPFVGLVSASPAITGVVGSNVLTPASVKAIDKYGNPVPRIYIQFSRWSGEGSLSGSQQTTNENGIATVGSWTLGPKTGQQIIRADDSRTGATTLVYATALPAPATQLVIIDGNTQAGQAGQRLCTSPVIAVRDQFGNGIGGVDVVFTPAVGSGAVTESSVLTSSGTGYANPGAWTLSASATQTLVVTSSSLPGVSLTLTAAVAPPAQYSACVRYVGDNITPRVKQAVTLAVQRWQRVITAHVQTTPLLEAANRCFAGQPAINELVEDLLVFVQVTAIDGPGNSVARAGPCTVHQPSNLSQMALLQLDSADIALQLGQGTLDNMVAHEFGHVLGFGTLWVTLNLFDGSLPNDPFLPEVQPVPSLLDCSVRMREMQFRSRTPARPLHAIRTGDAPFSITSSCRVSPAPRCP